MPDSQCIKHFLEWGLQRILQTLEESFSRAFLPSFKTQKVLLLKVIEVCNAPHISFVVELVHCSVAGNHIHRLAAEEMNELSLDLCRAAALVRAECLGFFLVSDERSAAVRACFREVGENSVRGSHAQLHRSDLRDDLSSFLHIDVVAYMNIQQLHLVGIVEGCPLDNGSAELYRLQVCHRGDCSCPSYLIVYADQTGECLLGLEFICHRPPRELGCVAEFFLIWELIDLYDDAVGRERKCFTFCVPICYELFDFFYATADFSLVRDRQAPFRSLVESFFVGSERQVFSQHMVEGAFESSICYLAAVDELQRSRCCISWISKRLFLVLFTFFIKPVECCPRHVDLAPYFKFFRPWLRFVLCRDEACWSCEGLRYVGDVSYVFGHIVTYGPVASCEGTEESSVSVSQTNGGAVELELATVCKGIAYPFSSTFRKGFNFRNVIGVSEREHRIFVRMLLEFLSPVTADLLCRGVFGYEFRILCLNGFQLLEEHVEVIIAHDRIVLNVVPSVGLIENVPELFCPDICLCLFHNRNNLQKY